MRWSSSGTAVEVAVPTSDPRVASVSEDPLVLLQYVGVDLKPNLDIVSEGQKRTAGWHFMVFKYIVFKFAWRLP